MRSITTVQHTSLIQKILFSTHLRRKTGLCAIFVKIQTWQSQKSPHASDLRFFSGLAFLRFTYRLWICNLLQHIIAMQHFLLNL